MIDTSGQKNRIRMAWILLLVVSVLAVFLVSLLPPVAQWPAYHHFADTRRLWDIPNALNVLSNVPFLIVGVTGFALVKTRTWACWQEALPFAVAFVGLILTGAGSAYYHWAPDNIGLFWDRLPMTLVFASLVAIAVMERISVRAGLYLLPVLIVCGLGSVLYWIWTESLGRGDLRWYAFMQFYSMLLLLLLLLLFHRPRNTLKYYAGMLLCYALAKWLEWADFGLYRFDKTIISGHTLKHLAAAASALFLLALCRVIRFPSRPLE